MHSLLAVLAQCRIGTLDITGGAPELHPRFRELVREARKLGCRVIDRCNLSILREPGFEDLADFLARQQVEIVASLPCYEQDNVDHQRGKGVFELSIKALRQLNALGYGMPDSMLRLDLVYNPQGAMLPPPQAELESAYRQALQERHGIHFNALLVLCNMPIRRFGSTLLSTGGFAGYMRLLKSSHRQENLERVMCRRLISVDWQGLLYDCDFNQMLHMPLGGSKNKRLEIKDLLNKHDVLSEINVADHCYACTAGQGSSCGGALN